MVDRDISQVVVIEDDPAASLLMTRILHAYGVHDVFQAPDGRAGINLVRSMQPDLVVLDLMMPGVDGFDVLDELKEDKALRAVPVIVVTAKDLTLDERQRLSGQVESLLQKGSFMDDGVLESLLEKLG
jgi:CheY-like chemotaxis protein